MTTPKARATAKLLTHYAERVLRKGEVALNLCNALLAGAAAKERSRYLCVQKSCAQWGTLSVGERLFCQEHGQAMMAASTPNCHVHGVVVSPLAVLLDEAIDDAIDELNTRAFHDDTPIPYSIVMEYKANEKKGTK